MTEHSDRQHEEAPEGEASDGEALPASTCRGDCAAGWRPRPSCSSARERTTLLTSAVDDADLVKQHSPLMSPLVWDLAHVANQEELWLLRAVGGRDPMHPEIDPLYDAFEHPRAKRPTLPLLTPREARRYGHEVRGRVLDLIERVKLPDGEPVEPASAPSSPGPGRVRVRHDRAARGAARRDDARHPSAAVGPGGAVRSPAAARPRRRGVAARRGARARRPVHHGHLGGAVGAGQRAARPRGATSPASGWTPRRSPTRRTRRSSPTAATTTPGCGRRTAGTTGSGPG